MGLKERQSDLLGPYLGVDPDLEPQVNPLLDQIIGDAFRSQLVLDVRRGLLQGRIGFFQKTFMSDVFNPDSSIINS